MDKRSLTRSAGVVALVYIAVASAWILFSDRWVLSLFGETSTVATLQTLKGWLFVAFTGVLLYSLMRHAVKQIEGVAFKDSLSGLPNRLAFTMELEVRCELATARQQQFTLSVLDIDYFTDLNDELGHVQADSLLVRISDRLKEQVDNSWFVARLGGDEFGLLSPLGMDPEARFAQLDLLQAKLTQGSAHPLLKEQRVSAGSSRFPDDGPSSSDLFLHADMALSSAKRKGRNRHKVYQEGLKHNRIERIALLKDLKKACANGNFHIAYQPQWSISRSCWSGAEALVRWHHESRGLVSPSIFIPLAEKEGLISSITELVFTQALSEIQDAAIDRERLPSLSINLSHIVLTDSQIMERLFCLMQRGGSTLPDMVLEITETAAMRDLSDTVAAMGRWRQQGVSFSIDDFGTGYSSLARLKQLPISELKIDRSFVRDIPEDHDGALITKAIMAMAEALSLNIVAEGVETAEQASFLAAHGCTSLQGYFLAHPMPIAKLKKLLQNQRTPLELPIGF